MRRRRRAPRAPALLAFGGLFLAALPGLPAGAQTLDRVDALVQEGRMEAAREELLEWEAATARPAREERQRALWLRAVLTVDPAQAEPTLRRLALEYPGGTFTDRALYRLGLAASLRGETAEAADHFRVLVRDYPNSPVRTRAQVWLRDNRAALADADRAGPSRGGMGPEVGDADRPEGNGAGDFAAQVGAFGSEENARAVVAELADAGFEARVVLIRGSDFFRVRVGRFRTADEARRLIERLRARGFDAGLGTGVSTERRVGGGPPSRGGPAA